MPSEAKQSEPLEKILQETVSYPKMAVVESWEGGREWEEEEEWDSEGGRKIKGRLKMEGVSAL